MVSHMMAGASLPNFLHAHGGKLPFLRLPYIEDPLAAPFDVPSSSDKGTVQTKANNHNSHTMSGLEVIGVVASIGSLVDIANRAFRASLKYIRAIKDAPKAARLLTTEIQNICGVLHSLKVFAGSLEDNKLLILDTKALHLHYIDLCCHILTEIRLKLEKCQNDFNSDHKRKTILRSLKWPYSEEETTKLLDRVSADKQTINLALTVDSTSALLLKLSRQHQDVT